MKGIRVFVTVSPVLNEQLETRAKESGCSSSQIISIALTNYLGPPDPISITKADMEELRTTIMDTTEFMRKYPLTFKECFPEPPTPYIQNGVIVTKQIQEELNTIIQEQEPIHTGLIMPDMSKVRVRPDPDIKHSFSLHEIKPGDGETHRLKAIGIDPVDIVKARRNMRAGREYDKSLEQYFNLL
jgi:hypothetical protein